MEPTYSYIKGQGWVIVTGYVVKDREGRNVRYEIREPSKGEGWFRINRTSQVDYSPGIPWVKDGIPNHEAVAKHIGNYRAEQFKGWSNNEDFRSDYWFYITLVPL